MSSIYDELCLLTENLQLEENVSITRIKELVQGLQMQSYVYKNIHELSSSEYQMGLIACGLITYSSLTVLDDALEYLDSKKKDIALVYFYKLKKRFQMSFIIFDNHLESVMDICDGISILKEDGHLISTFTRKNYLEYENELIKEHVYLPYRRIVRHYHELHKSSSLVFKDCEILHKNKQTTLFSIEDIEIHDEDFVGILGKDSCGISSFFDLLIGQNSYGGTIQLKEQSLRQISLRKRNENIFYIPANFPDIFIETSVEKEISRLLKEVIDNKTTTDIQMLLHPYGLDEYMDINPKELPLCLQKCLAIELAILSCKEFILIDTIDAYVNDKQLRQIFERLQYSHATIIFSSYHDFVIREYATQMLHVSDGRMGVFR